MSGPESSAPDWWPEDNSNLPNPTLATDRASSATLEESLAFLKGAMPSDRAVYSFRHSSQVTTLKFSGGVMYWTSQIPPALPQYSPTSKYHKVALKDLDPIDVAVVTFENGAVGINVRCTGGANVTEYYEISDMDGTTTSSNKFSFWQWERDDAERIALALRHAIKLSGGTVSPF